MMQQKYLLCVLVTCGLMTQARADEKVIIGGESTAQQYVPVAVSLNVGSLGYGVALMWDTTPNLGVTLGYKNHQLGYNKNIDTSLGAFKRQSTQSHSTAVQAEWRPWVEQSSLFAKSSYVAFGMAYLQQSYTLSGRENNVYGKMEHNQISPYVGLGVRPMLGLHWGWLAEVGVYYMQQPSMHLNSTTSQLKLAEKDQWFPTAQLGVVYHF
ncbi:outer membrane beta-barrel protein [Acinetobacter rathckeae]|uniref:outer membrane beta-barrel protein n=1 Tax=Acinetobacter rathckeae TaxID=2605272 RepID=UPI001BB399CF|nr:outer membrane beta-barrel protein [Acinetobacter rathckeae]MBF7694639.1 outer membrane beta-barrel protein [Acinetobacter rathckeae]